MLSCSIWDRGVTQGVEKEEECKRGRKFNTANGRQAIAFTFIPILIRSLPGAIVKAQFAPHNDQKCSLNTTDICMRIVYVEVDPYPIVLLHCITTYQQNIFYELTIDFFLVRSILDAYSAKSWAATLNYLLSKLEYMLILVSLFRLTRHLLKKNYGNLSEWVIAWCLYCLYSFDQIIFNDLFRAKCMGKFCLSRKN